MNSRPAGKRRVRSWFLVGALMLIAFLWLVREPIRQWLFQKAALANEAPAPELISVMIRQASDPRQALFDAWSEGGIVHREVAMRRFTEVFPSSEPLPSDAEAMLLSAALDADLTVRETAMSALAQRAHPSLSALAVAQLDDVDPEVRRLGLIYLKGGAANVGVPQAVRLLDDPDPGIINLSLKLLEKWSGQDFGVQLTDGVMQLDPSNGQPAYREDAITRILAGRNLAHRWWQSHEQEFPLETPPLPAAARVRRLLSAGDFALRNLDGEKVRLSDFRGKVVLLNFWTTWCTACVDEMPVLAALQAKHADGLVVLGVSLDFTPDNHGHIGGHAAVEESGLPEGNPDDIEPVKEAMNRVRRKIGRVVERRGVNYPILLDKQNEVGGRYNGGELPTTLIIDEEGAIRRRFIGSRDLEVFEAMVGEAAVAPME